MISCRGLGDRDRAQLVMTVYETRLPLDDGVLDGAGTGAGTGVLRQVTNAVTLQTRRTAKVQTGRTASETCAGIPWLNHQ